MRSYLTLTFALAMSAACAEPEPTFAPPGAIVGRTLPGVPEDKPDAGAGGDFGAPYDIDAGRPTTTLKEANANGKGPPEPTDCFLCHANVPPPNVAPPFAFGGRAFNGLVPAPNVDVVVINGDAAKTRLGPVKSDADGYFWLKAAVTVNDGQTKVRTAAGRETPMNSSLKSNADSNPKKSGDGACNREGCHGSSRGQLQAR